MDASKTPLTKEKPGINSWQQVELSEYDGWPEGGNGYFPATRMPARQLPDGKGGKTAEGPKVQGERAA